MKEDRMYDVTRWLVALVAVVLPLSILIMVSALFGYNYPGREWTRFLLFASWIAWAISLTAGVINLIGFSLAEPLAGVKKAEAGSDEPPSESPEDTLPEESVGEFLEETSLRMSSSLLVSQAAFFLGGAFIYIAFCCWMILPSIGV
ncbi:MAG: hypothetical protein SWK76_08370 [Actinomycetota bacterium]|nr:hypothetical protein [Actinomycetota bacterium]